MLSAINALTLSPALSALLLKPATGKKSLLTPFYKLFNRIFGRITDSYVSFSSILARKFIRSAIFMACWSTSSSCWAARFLPVSFPKKTRGTC
jgi:HAE1 family hydrophobic/amphiphilic exporter-1